MESEPRESETALAETRPVCRRCGREDGEDLITRRAPTGDGALTHCADCAQALGLDWCCRCYRWRPAADIDPENELCPACRRESGAEPPRQPDPVQGAMCGSCIFRQDGAALPLAPGRLGEIQAYLITGTAHLCHHDDVAGDGKAPAVVCRGGRDFQLQVWHRMGIIAEGTDQALNAARATLGFAPVPGRPPRRAETEGQR